MRAVIIVLTMLLAGVGYTQSVIRTPDPNVPLESRWRWAAQAARSQKSSGRYWIGYSFDRLCHENEMVGNYYTDGARHPTLTEVLSGGRIQPGPLPSKGPGPMVLKETAVLLGFDPGKASPDQVRVTDLSLFIDLQGHPIFWLGLATPEESIAFLNRTFGTLDPECKKEVIAVIGLHKRPALVIPFLHTILMHEKENAIRGGAAFWLSAQDDPSVAGILGPILEKESSEEVIDQALAGLEETEGSAATKLLIDWSGEEHSLNLRRRAIFWLGQRAGKEAVKTLEEAAFKDPDEKIQEQALFAIAEMDKSSAIPELITIAKTHPNPKVRKQAIYFLGETGDPQARLALIQILAGGK